MEKVVGFGKDADIIMQKLTRGTKELDVISIFGMAGLGKTTLTRKVYNDPSVVNHFDVQVWCSISQIYNVRTLLVEILKQITRDKSKIRQDDDDIADKVRKSLISKRYLIVLDDIWKVEAWEDLRLSFPNGEKGSRVMVTTRVEEVAKQLKHYSDPYSLRFLTVEESWELLKNRVFRGENSCPSDLLEAGLQVAKHCKGLPLVIVLIAGIIGNMERQASLWLEVANNLSSHVLGEQSMKAIQSSYDHLESHLKPPLLSMAYYFPENFNISSSNLFKLWMDAEFVHKFDSGDMWEEAAKVCLNDLVNRSLVMISKRRARNDVMKCCMLHDVVREFCLRKLTEKNFIQHILPYNTHHASHTAKLRLLWVLKVEGVESPSSLVEALKQTNQLRYLDIKVVNQFDFKWVSHLCHLQTLRVYSYTSNHIRTSIAPLWKMTALRHVDIRDFSFIWGETDIKNFNNSCGAPVLLENMKTFGSYRISMDDMNLQFWDRFPNLEKFDISFRGMDLGNTTNSSLIGQDNVLLLFLRRSFPVAYFDRNIHSRHSPACLFPFYLKDVSLEWLVIREDMLSSIASLPNLEYLRFRNVFLGDLGPCWDVGDIMFPALKYLKLRNPYGLSKWHCSEGSFPVLERLVLQYLACLEEIPCSFVDIPTLKLIKLIDCNNSVTESALNIKKEIEDNTGCDTLQVLISKH